MINSKEPILGILGGMGPYATIDFIRNIYDLTPNISVDSDHIRIITDSNVKKYLAELELFFIMKIVLKKG